MIWPDPPTSCRPIRRVPRAGRCRPLRLDPRMRRPVWVAGMDVMRVGVSGGCRRSIGSIIVCLLAGGTCWPRSMRLGDPVQQAHPPQTRRKAGVGRTIDQTCDTMHRTIDARVRRPNWGAFGLGIKSGASSNQSKIENGRVIIASRPFFWRASTFAAFALCGSMLLPVLRVVCVWFVASHSE